MSIKRVLTTILLISVCLNVVVWMLVFFLFPYDDPGAVLHYSVDVGTDFIGQGMQILLLPLAGLLILVGNSMLGWAMYQTDRRSAWVFWSIIPLVQIILIGAFLLIWRVNVG